jgi:ABC-type branched-subunit amino acid transport system ATPase component
MTATNPDLEVDDLTVRYGGRTAVHDVSLRAGAGRVTGLIGPNGAGKTTIFNACAGVVSPAAGQVRLGGHSLQGLRTSRRAQLGLGRTFQRMELFDSMTVSENVGMGPELAYAGRRAWTQLVSTKHQQVDIRERAVSALDRCGITGLALARAGDLSTGQRRLVELARAIASPFRFLLLDEPSSGLDINETDAFGQILVNLVADRQIGILLVEHDMALVRRTCSYVYVLDFGRLITHGPTGEVLASDLVRAAYLGAEVA